ncbi:MAG: Lrp/AsnC family transcriptional regulator [Candidatus Micrarchaeota archaeon]|nr:Lrp/AsnC family transcriptional regulator [Candidatus Micrarchaeota archaeon]
MAYKLDKINRRLLYELDKNARVSDSRLGRIVRRSRESVRLRIMKMQKEGIIQEFSTSINPGKMGYMGFKMYFQLANIPDERKKFHDYIRKLPGIYWFGENDGVWDLHATFYARDVEEFNALKNKVYTDFRHLIIKRDIGVLVNVRQYPKRYLVPELKERPEPTMFAGEVVENKPDELDKKILRILARDARIPIVELARKTGSTADIVRNRMKKMEKDGVIMQYRVAVDHMKLGYEMFKTFVYFYNLPEKDEQRLIEYARQSPNIVYLVRQLSSWDIEIEMMGKDYAEFNEFMNEIRMKFAGVIRNYEVAFMKDDNWVFGERGLTRS